MNEAIEKAIKVLADKAETARQPDESMRLTQACLNLAHAMAIIGSEQREAKRLS